MRDDGWDGKQYVPTNRNFKRHADARPEKRSQKPIKHQNSWPNMSANGTGTACTNYIEFNTYVLTWNLLLESQKAERWNQEVAAKGS